MQGSFVFFAQIKTALQKSKAVFGLYIEFGTANVFKHRYFKSGVGGKFGLIYLGLHIARFL